MNVVEITGAAETKTVETTEGRNRGDNNKEDHHNKTVDRSKDREDNNKDHKGQDHRNRIVGRNKGRVGNNKDHKDQDLHNKTVGHNNKDHRKGRHLRLRIRNNKKRYFIGSVYLWEIFFHAKLRRSKDVKDFKRFSVCFFATLCEKKSPIKKRYL